MLDDLYWLKLEDDWDGILRMFWVGGEWEFIGLLVIVWKKWGHWRMFPVLCDIIELLDDGIVGIKIVNVAINHWSARESAI